MVVDLPAPFGPRNPCTSPSVTLRSSPSSACVRPNRFVRPEASITVVMNATVRLFQKFVNVANRLLERPGSRLETMRILFIGGNGTISAFASRLAVEQGHELTLLNRGTSTRRPPIEGAETLVGDMDDLASVGAAIGTRDFDVVVNWRSFHPFQVESDVALFEGRTGQYVYISSASAYAKPVAALPITESTALRNPFWEYSNDKILSEDVLVRAFRDRMVPGHDRAPVAHLRRAGDPDPGWLDEHRPRSARQADPRARRRHADLDADPFA